MATLKSALTNILQEYLIRKTLENFEPQLYFYKLGEKPVIPAGYNTIRWAKFTKLGELAAVTTEGTTESDQTFIAASVNTVTPTEYIGVITITDRLLKDSVLDWLGGAATALGDSLARTIDKAIQLVIMAGGSVMYPGTRTARANLVSGDTLTVGLLIKAAQRLKAWAAPTFDGFYVAVMHPNVAYDLMTSTSAGGWQDIHKYTTPDNIFKGELGAIGGVRIVECPFVSAVATNVFPVLVLGKGAYGVGDFESLKTYLTPATASDSDPAVQRRKVSAKVAFGTAILQGSAMVRIETYSTDVTA